MADFDFYIAGRWRNADAVRQVTQSVRDAGKTAYCFLENTYEGESIDFTKPTEQTMQQMEATALDDPMVRKIFENDMDALKAADGLILVFPAGLSAHMELGTAYGLGKKIYAVGQPEKTESLYLMIEKMFPDSQSLHDFLKADSSTKTEVTNG